MLRDVSRIKHEDPTEQHVDPLNVGVIIREYKLKGVATLSGFLGRSPTGIQDGKKSGKVGLGCKISVMA